MTENNIEMIQWYPGHMAKANREIREKLKLIDLVIEIVDARLPQSSKNPDILQYTANKKHLLLLNKSDLADPETSEKWLAYFTEQKMADAVMLYDAFDRNQKTLLIKRIHALNSKNKPIVKCLICGIPNVGKSTVINSLIGKKKTQIGNKPGVTKGQQWLKTDENILLLDTPGILWPKFEDPMVGIHLAWLGSIKDTIYEKQNLAADLLKYLVKYYPEQIEVLYKISLSQQPLYEVFDAISKSRGFLLKGGEYDYERTCNQILNDFKNGKIGRITLEQPV
ncbi:MAG: ribosome biosis GTPase [Eubacteriaceae bacterium]|jgi:ribosome biogenesis GTPase A|nr:ribosome biosis GTPase [Eubacteriaceae bacterium]MDK2935666.1 ribosome biosis GTPase [Eubacteriaceae bacterium]MDN5307991.1 ribosome biosis GTPase [Eubacteriaceae bacterium]